MERALGQQLPSKAIESVCYSAAEHSAPKIVPGRSSCGWKRKEPFSPAPPTSRPHPFLRTESAHLGSPPPPPQALARHWFLNFGFEISFLNGVSLTASHAPPG